MFDSTTCTAPVCFPVRRLRIAVEIGTAGGDTRVSMKNEDGDVGEGDGLTMMTCCGVISNLTKIYE